MAEGAAAREAAAAPTRVADRPSACGWTVLVHALPLLAALLFFRVEKGLQLVPAAGAGEWLALLAPEVGFVSLFSAVWLLAGRVGGAAGRWWRPFFRTAVAAIYLAALLDHLWFLNTGTRLHFSLIAYSLRYLQMLTALLASGIDLVFWSRLLLVLLCFLLGLRLETKRVTTDARPGWPPALVAAAVGLAVLLPPWPVPYRVADLWDSAAVELFDDVYLERPEAAELAPYLVPPEELYRAPRLVAASGERPPDIVLILLESTRRDVTPPWADPAMAPLTPNLAALAPAAVAFDEVYASVSHTSKALVGILCGTWPRLDMPIVEARPGGLDLPCLPHLLAASGYRTGFFQTAPGRFEQRPGLVANLGYSAAGFGEHFLRPPFERMGYLGLDEHAMVEPAVAWAAAGEEPYFLTLLTVSPHHPYEVPGQRGRWLGETREQYLAAIHHQDRFVGSVLDGLGRTGALDDAVVVILGDHGEAFGEHRRFQHDAVPYQEVTHVPLLVLGPERRVGPARRVGGLRHHFDLLPTLLGLAGVRWEGTVPGRDLFATTGHERVFSSCWYSDYCIAMVEGDVKFVYHFGRRPLEAFDLARDPGEGRNIGDDLAERQVLAARDRIAAKAASIERFWEVREGAAERLGASPNPSPPPRSSPQ